MSTIRRSASPTRGHAKRPVQVAPPVKHEGLLSVRWSISSQALLGHDGPEATVDWKIDLRAGSAAAELVNPRGHANTSETRVIAASESVRHTRDGELIHIEARDAAGRVLLTGTLRQEARGVHVLYARTSLLQDLGLGGGRYEAIAWISRENE